MVTDPDPKASVKDLDPAKVPDPCGYGSGSTTLVKKVKHIT
jgi:hypothetical protein